MIVASTLRIRCWRQPGGSLETRQHRLGPSHRQNSDHDHIRQHYPAFDRSLEVGNQQTGIHLELGRMHGRQGWQQDQETGVLVGNRTWDPLSVGHLAESLVLAHRTEESHIQEMPEQSSG